MEFLEMRFNVFGVAEHIVEVLQVGLGLCQVANDVIQGMVHLAKCHQRVLKVLLEKQRAMIIFRTW